MAAFNTKLFDTITEDKPLSVGQISTGLGISVSAVKKLIDSGKISGFHLGAQRRVQPVELLRYLEKQPREDPLVQQTIHMYFQRTIALLGTRAQQESLSPHLNSSVSPRCSVLQAETQLELGRILGPGAAALLVDAGTAFKDMSTPSYIVRTAKRTKLLPNHAPVILLDQVHNPITFGSMEDEQLFAARVFANEPHEAIATLIHNLLGDKHAPSNGTAVQ